MRILLALGLALTLVTAAWAEPAPDMQGFELVISDTGAAPESWDANPTRVYVEVAGEPLYFSGMAGAFFALRERFGSRMHVNRMLVADYLTAGFGDLLDARRAWYFWDAERLAPGNLPLILALPSKAAARGQTARHTGTVLDFKELTARLGRWCTQAESTACWKGHSGWDNTNWTTAWNQRWDGWTYDHHRGWCDSRLPYEPGIHYDYRGSGRRHHGDPVYVSPPRHYDNDDSYRERERRERLEREREERQRRQERERQEREQRERERREREERDRQPVPPVNKGAPAPQPPPREDPPPPQQVQPEQKDDEAQPAPPPPPTKSTNDPKK